MPGLKSGITGSYLAIRRIRMPLHFNKTKIICTIGPATCEVDTIIKLVENGMNVARMNMSHEGHDVKLAHLKNIRKAEKKIGYPIPIMVDLCGPKLRLGEIKEPFKVSTGDEIILTSDDVQGDNKRVSTTYKKLPQDVNRGDHILINDGLIKFEVIESSGNDVRCTVIDGGLMQSKKGLNLPNTKMSIPLITEKDRKDIDFGIEHGADFFAMSFVRNSEDIKELKSIILRKTADIPVIAKVERPDAVEDIDAICEESDAVMIARGDLGVEVPPEEVPLLQKKIILKCIEKNTPVITATQMLESMITSPRPTRAETSDVANAVLDGTDAVMLSAETSVGKYPVETVAIMNRICMKAEERGINSNKIMLSKKSEDSSRDFLVKNMTRAVCSFAADIDAAAIIVLTKSGKTARRLSRFRINIPILAFVEDEKVIKQNVPVWGVRSELIDNMSDTDTTLKRAKELAVSLGYIKSGECVIFVAGIPLLETRKVNMMKVEVV